MIKFDNAITESKLSPGNSETAKSTFNSAGVSSINEEHDELNVVMYWDTLENFEAWRASDAFKKAHSRDGQGHGESPVISNQIVISEIVSTLTV